MANRYIEVKTEEYSSKQVWSLIGEQYPEGLSRKVTDRIRDSLRVAVHY